MNRARKESFKTKTVYQNGVAREFQCSTPEFPLVYKDKRGYRAKRTFFVTCNRKQHRVILTLDGRICFLDHGCASATAVLMEANLVDKEHKGCAYLAHVLLNLHSSHGWDTHYRSRRSSTQKRAFDAGIPDEMHKYIARILDHKSSRRCKSPVRDEYATPFSADPWARVSHMLHLRQEFVRGMMRRVEARRKDSGNPFPEGARPHYY